MSCNILPWCVFITLLHSHYLSESDLIGVWYGEQDVRKWLWIGATRVPNEAHLFWSVTRKRSPPLKPGNISRPSLSLSNICSLHPGNPWHLFFIWGYVRASKAPAKLSWSHNDESVRPGRIQLHKPERLQWNCNLRRSFLQLHDQLWLEIMVDIIKVRVNPKTCFFVIFLWMFCSLWTSARPVHFLTSKYRWCRERVCYCHTAALRSVAVQAPNIKIHIYIYISSPNVTVSVVL